MAAGDLPSRLSSSTPDSKSTPDPRTGLTKRIGIRKNRSSPLKGTRLLRAGSPTKAMEQLPPRTDERGASASINQQLPHTPQTHDQASPGTEGQPLSTSSSEEVAEPGWRLGKGKQMRAVSGMSTGSVVQNETFEEINPSSIVEMVSQSFEMAPEASQVSSAAQQATSGGGPSRTLTSSGGGPEDCPKARGDFFPPNSAIPQTPPNQHVPKRKYIPIRGGPNPNSSSNQPGLAERSPATVAYPHSAPITPQKSTLKKPSSLEVFDNKETSASPGGSASEAQGRSSPELRGSNLPTKAETSDENAQERRTGSTTDSTIPESPFKGSNLRKLKNSRSARRMSMNSPPPQSSLSTATRKDSSSPTEIDPRSSQDHIGTRRPAAVPLQPTAPGNTSTDSEELDGAAPPASSTDNTQPRPPLVEHSAESTIRDQDPQAVAAEGHDVSQELPPAPARPEKVVDNTPANQPSDDTPQAESSSFTQSSPGGTTTKRQVHASWPGTSSEPRGEADKRTAAICESKRYHRPKLPASVQRC